ncbi:MAG: FAD-dependent oxidoreductase, partial [Candidatus Marinimicrobia bacterium]|nr:FAD-dependent oxidoreductase [Candidatus Neomarinimicrobiota bacterium]
GIEYASIFSILNIDVTVISRSDQLFGFIDREMTDKLSFHLRENGVRLLMQDEINEVLIDSENHPQVHLKSGKKIYADMMMVVSGRSGSAKDLIPELAGVNISDRGLIQVNKHYQTNIEHIYAVGDIIGFPSLASTSLEQGRKASQHACLGKIHESFQNFPFGIYSIPVIAYVGKNEEELSQDRVPYVTGIAHYREIAKGEIIEDHTGYFKLLFHQDTRKLLGAHIIGSGATELIHIAQAVINFDSGLDYFLDAIFNYPTLAECYKIAAINADRKFK